MELIGNILKETTRFGYGRNTSDVQNRDEHATIQKETLQKLLSKAKDTNFGIIHKFDEILRDNDIVPLFQSEVPITDYESFQEDWLSTALDGTPDVIWPGRTKYYARSSGTTGISSKRLPVSSDMLKQFQRTTYQQIIQLHSLNLPGAFYQSKFLVLGGSTKLSKYGSGQYEGDLSGILAKNKSFAFAPFSKPGKKISQLENWNEKIDRIVEKAPKWNIGVISGVPSWVLLLLERIIEEHRLTTIHDIWPNLSLYLHGGVFIEPYREKLNKKLARPIVYQNTFLASEGYFAYQRNVSDDSLELLIDEGVFYEFVEERYFDQLRNADYYDIPTLTFDEVKPHRPYAMVISTNAGLWRYNLGDIIEFTDLKAKQMKIVGRLSHSLNICGEHLSEANLVKSVEETAKILRVSTEEFCVYPSKDFNRHNWYVGANQGINDNQFSAILDERLSLKNDDYACVRKYLLKSPRVKVLPVEKFYEFLAIKEKYGAQNKFPRVMSPKQASDWETFLTNSENFERRFEKFAV